MQNMRNSPPFLLILCGLLPALVADRSIAASPFLGFSRENAATERAVELQFDRGLSASEIMTRIREAASAPNPIGSPHDKMLAYETMRELRAWGWDAHVESFSVLYPSPSR